MEIDNKQEIVKYNKTVLENGIIVLSEEIKSVESFSLGIGLGAGSRDDDFDMPGIAHFLEHSVYRRTRSRTSRQISNQFDSMGAYSNAYTTKEHTLFYARAAKQHFAKTFELLADIVVNPIFKKEEISKERQIIIEEIKSYDDDPEELIFDLTDSVVFPDNTLGNGIDGTAHSVKKINIDILGKFHSEHYIPANIIIAASGNISHEELLREAHFYFDTLARQQSKIKREKPAVSVSNLEIPKPIQQAHLIFAKQTISALDTDRHALAAFNIIFGDGLSSRIYQKLREKEGLAYSVYSSVNLYTDTGSIQIYIGTDPSNLAKSEDLIMEELRRLKKSKITKTELARAKEQLKSGKIFEYENMSLRMQNLVKNEMVYSGYETMSGIVSAVDNIKLSDLERLADMYFNENNWSRVAIIPS